MDSWIDLIGRELKTSKRLRIVSIVSAETIYININKENIMEEQNNQLKENMHRFGTKNLEEQARPSDLADLYPIDRILYAVEELAGEMQSAHDHYRNIYGSGPSRLSIDEQKKRALGIMAKLQKFIDAYEKTAKSLHNM